MLSVLCVYVGPKTNVLQAKINDGITKHLLFLLLWVH